MKRLLILVLLGCFFSTSMFPMMRRLPSFVLYRGVRTCANEIPRLPVKSLAKVDEHIASIDEHIASIDEQLAKLVKNSEEQNERLSSIFVVCGFTAFLTWILTCKAKEESNKTI